MLLKRKIVVQALLVVVGLLAVGSNAFGDLINMTGAEQQVIGRIGYKDSFVEENLIKEHYYPETALGLENATLSGSFSNSGYSVSGSLTSDLTSVEDQITANGSAFASAVWGPPTEADWLDVHGGAGSTFTLYFNSGLAPVYFNVSGQLNMTIENESTLHPDESFAYVKLSSDDGNVITEEWSVQRDCSNGNISVPFAQGLLLDYNKNYILEAHTRAGTVAMLGSPSFKSRTTSFSFTATTNVVPVPGAVILGSIGLAYSGLRLRRRKDL